MEMTGPFPGREARFPVLVGQSIAVTVERSDDVEPQLIDGELIDVSRSGLKLSMSDAPAVREAVVVRLSVPEIDLDLRIDAKVCWSQPAPRDRWYMGCALNPKLPEQVLTKLAIAGYLQRRQDERHAIDLAVRMRCEGTQTVAPAQLLDYSLGGLRLSSPQSAELGQRLLLELDQGPNCREQVVARTVWELSTKNGHEIGCTFVNKDGFRAFREFLSRHRKAAAATRTTVRKMSRHRLLVLATLLAAAACVCFFLL
jgi:hypothetical protein